MTTANSMRRDDVFDVAGTVWRSRWDAAAQTYVWETRDASGAELAAFLVERAFVEEPRVDRDGVLHMVKVERRRYAVTVDGVAGIYRHATLLEAMHAAPGEAWHRRRAA